MLMYSVIFLLGITAVRSFMHLDIQPDEKRCVGQELDEEDYAVFSMSAMHVRKDLAHVKQSLQATVEDPSGNIVISEKIKLGGRAREEQLSISLRGVYNLCFELKEGICVCITTFINTY
jgi:hypothetical protein